MIDLKKYRVIDLSQKLQPGILKVNGEYKHGGGVPPFGNRRLELRQWIYKEDKTFMHWIDTETHIGTHVEAAAHLNIDGKEGGKSVSELSLEKFIGEATILNLTYKKPVDGKGQPITLEDLKSIKDGDIVILWTTYPDFGVECPYISEEIVKYLIKKQIKQLGILGIGLPPVSHDTLLKNELPIIEGLTNLDKVKKERVFYIGLPLNWGGMDSCPIRAIALEEK